MARGNRVLVCFAHRRFFHPFDHAWLPFPACLQDWVEEQMSRHWIFTAAQCTQCREIPPQDKGGTKPGPGC